MSRNMGVFLSTYSIKSLKDQVSSNLALELIFTHCKFLLQQHTWDGGTKLYLEVKQAKQAPTQKAKEV